MWGKGFGDADVIKRQVFRRTGCSSGVGAPHQERRVCRAGRQDKIYESSMWRHDVCVSLMPPANDGIGWSLCAKACDWQPVTGAATVRNKQLMSQVSRVLPWCGESIQRISGRPSPSCPRVQMALRQMRLGHSERDACLILLLFVSSGLVKVPGVCPETSTGLWESTRAIEFSGCSSQQKRQKNIG